MVLLSNVFVVTGFRLLAFSWTISNSDVQSVEVCKSEACKTKAQRILKYMDPSVKPCTNFYKFACGKFLETAEIHKDKTQNNSFIQLDDRLDEQLKSIVSEPAQPCEPAPHRQVKRLYSLCLDEEKIDSQGVKHAVDRLRQAGGWPVLGDCLADNWNLLDTEIKLNNLSIGGDSLFNVYMTVDSRNTSRRVLEVDQPSLGLPREYLVKGLQDPVVRAYYQYMVDISMLYGADRATAEQQLNQTLLFKIELAKITVRREDRRDYSRMYNPYTLPQLMKEQGWVNWTALLESILVGKVALRKDELIIVVEEGYLNRLKDLLTQYSNIVIANHMMWDAARGLVPHLTTRMRQRKAEFDGVVLGIQSRPPRWKECIGVASSMAIALSSLYVARFFDKSSKKEALAMTEHIRQEIAKDIEEIDWMDDKTRKRALHKASKVIQHIGYPDELVNTTKINEHYKDLREFKDDYLEAMLELVRWSQDYGYRQLREPVNKTDWRTHSMVAVVNAFYNPLENSIQFPAGILQHPFFSADVPHYVNYGTIGMIIGHEITHGFDDMGSQFNADGDLSNWWEEESMKMFNEKKKCMIDQYSGFIENQTKMHLNGINTQGENVADAGGLKLSLRAYHRQCAGVEPGLPGLEHYSSDQLFLLSMANMWCTRSRPEDMRLRITTDVHSPSEFRVNGPLMNLPEFSDIFQCAKDDPMNPSCKCVIW